MFQCLGLGTPETGGCGEDWYHPGCIVGLGPKWYESVVKIAEKPETKDAGATGLLPTITEDAEAAPPQAEGEPKAAEEEDDDDVPPPPGFPTDAEFEGLICYKCVDAHPWIKRYAGTSGFLAPVFLKQGGAVDAPSAPITTDSELASKKRKASDEDDDMASQTSKRPRSEVGAGQTPPEEAAEALDDLPIAEEPKPTSADVASICKLPNLPAAPEGQFSLFFTENFRDQFCRCATCFPRLKPHPQLLEEEETYEPPVSDDGASEHGSTLGSGSLLERGESALRNVDRVRAIEGVMAYNHLKDKLKPFFQKFAESGQAIGAEDIKEYFAKLRGDDQAIKEAGEAAGRDDLREEQSGY